MVRAAGIPEAADLDKAIIKCSEGLESGEESTNESSEENESYNASTACKTSGGQR